MAWLRPARVISNIDRMPSVIPSSPERSEGPYGELWAHIEPDGSRRLLISALACFAAKGFEGTTTREIAQSAGMSPSGLYAHYGAKIDLLYEIARIGHERSHEAVTAAVSAADGPEDRLAAFIGSFVIWHARFHTLAHVSEHELRRLEGEHMAALRAIRRAFQHELEEILQSGLDAGVFTFDDRHGVARAMLSLGIDVARWFRSDGAVAEDDLAGLYVQLALRMVEAPRP